MKIAIEAQRIFPYEIKHGMDFVALESIRELQKIDKENEYFIFVSPGEDHCLEETSNTHIVEVKCPTYPFGTLGWRCHRAGSQDKARPNCIVRVTRLRFIAPSHWY